MFCPKCGTQIQNDMLFCPKCGTNVKEYQTMRTENIDNTAPDISNDNANRGIAWLSYMGLLVLIPMLARKNSKLCQYHIKQGWTLLATEITYAIVTNIILVIINAIFPGRLSYLFGFYTHSTIYNIFNVIFLLGYIFFTVAAIIGIVHAAKGEEKEVILVGKIPWIADLLDKYYKN